MPRVRALKLVEPTVSAAAKPKLRFELESLLVTARDYPALFKLYAREIGPDRDRCRFAYNFDAAIKQNQAGGLMVLSARTDDYDETLAGFVYIVIGWPTKYKATPHAQFDMVYLHPEWRRGMTGVKMLRAAIEVCRKVGVKRVLAAEPVRFVNHSGLKLRRLFQFMGFKPLEISWERFL